MPDPFAGVTDEELQLGSIALQLACGKTHGVLVRRRAAWFCFLNKALITEAANRGIEIPLGPHHVSVLSKGPQAL
jgi:hypothetical protein